MTGDSPARDAVTRLVKGMIADGTLKPGAPMLSGAALAREAGCHLVTCQAALRALLADGTLARGPSRGARLRVAPPRGAPAADAETLRQALSRGLAARRRAAGLRQAELAKQLGVSVTSVGHAETGRLWQSGGFWRQADGLLLAGGALLRLHEEYQAAVVGPAPASPPETTCAAPVPVLPVNVAITPDGVTVTWPDGTETVARPPGWHD
jgi:DNA-binding transcriptional regulator YhcF (GntR family)